LRSLEGPEWAPIVLAPWQLGSDTGDSDWELAGAASCAWSAPGSLGPSRYPSAMPSPRGKCGSGGATPSERFDRTPSPEFPSRASLETVRAQLEEQAAQLRRAAGASDGFANHMCYERATEAGDGGGALALGGGGGGAVAPGGGGGVAVAPGGSPAGGDPVVLAASSASALGGGGALALGGGAPGPVEPRETPADAWLRDRVEKIKVRLLHATTTLVAQPSSAVPAAAPGAGGATQRQRRPRCSSAAAATQRRRRQRTAEEVTSDMN
jgi:hypothetical protein